MDLDRRKAFLYGITFFTGLVCFLMVLPFLGYLLTGLLLAFISYPLHKRLTSRISTRASASAVILMTVFAAILPFTVIIGAVGGDAADLVGGIDTSEGLEAIERVESLLLEYTGQSVDLEERLKSVIASVASYLPSGLSSAINLMVNISIGASLMLFLQFYSLKDGKKVVEWTKQFDFMDTQRQEMLYSSTAESVWAVVKGHVLIAFAQGILAGIGLMIFGVPNSLFWTFMMIILGFIPMIGSAFIWFPASIYLAMTGSLINAALLTAYGLIVVGGSDNFLRPLVVDDEADIHPFFILIGLIGGVGLFGPVGIFIGPVIFGVLKNFLDMIKELNE